MRTRKVLFYIALGVLIPVAFGLILPTQAHAGLRKKAVGSYLLRQSDGFQQILTLTTRGTALSQNSGQMEGPDTFGDQQGAWKHTGKREITIKTLDFTYEPNTGAFSGYGRSTFTGTFSKDFDEITGEVFVEIFSSDQDPLDPDEVPIDTFGPVTFEGKRITAD